MHLGAPQPARRCSSTRRAGSAPGCRCWTRFGPGAARSCCRRALAALIKGQTLACDLMDVDRYDRPVIRCKLPSGADLGCEMIRQGHAEEWTRYSGGAYARCGRR